MISKMNQSSCAEGRLPGAAPLANPYVPFQLEGPVRYEPRKAIVRGTLYPGLDLPLLGIANKNNLPVTPLSELQVLAFAVQELALYLDTHPEDAEALELYKQYQEMYQKCATTYQQQIRPLNHTSPSQHGTYAWLDDPWPWEFAANKGE